MSDNMDLSLDEYIKKKKITRGGKLRVAVGKKGKPGVSPGKKGRRALGTGYSVSPRGGRGRLNNRGGRGRGRGRANFTRGGPGRRNGGVIPARRGRGGFQGRRGNLNRSLSVSQLQLTPNSGTPRVSARGRFQTRVRSNLKTRFGSQNFRNLKQRAPRFAVRTGINPVSGFLNRLQPGIQSFARKRVQRARNLLTNRPNQSRILISRSGFGLVTRTAENNRRQRLLLQQKINRAQLARGNISGSTLRMDMEHGPAAQFFKGLVQAGSGAAWNERKPRSRSRSRTRRPPTATDVWTSTVRTVRNTDLDYRPTSSQSSSGLNPEIQRRIMLLQQQGRRTRGEDVLDNTISHDFRAPISSSRISLSDRFRMFMN